MNILVTGGAGYIGSHTVVALVNSGHDVTIVDDFSNSSPLVIPRIEKIINKKITVHTARLEDKILLTKLFSETVFDAVIHFAGIKAVGESTENPLLYYRANVDSTLTLLEVMRDHEVFNLVFSSSATVYGSAPVPYREDGPVGQGITNPYGKTKYVTEMLLQDIAISDPRWQIGALRYFNPVGAHPSGLIGEQPRDTPNNLMPYLTQVAVGARDSLSIFGDDYDTADGTGVRDYIHIDDLALGHVAMLEHLEPGFSAINLGSGKGTSVMELIKTFERVNDLSIPYQIVPRRAGDLPAFYAAVDIAHQKLDWKTLRSLDDMCRDSWNWQSQNPNGYT